MQHASSGQVVDFPLPAPEGPVGLKAWVAAHRAQRPGNAELQKQVRRGSTHTSQTASLLKGLALYVDVLLACQGGGVAVVVMLASTQG